MTKQLIQWYPGHIAKAEKQLKENLNKVDLVFEVRDARIPLATSHPYLQKWLKGKKQILVINRKDMINVDAHKAWDKKLRSEGKVPWWCDAKAGTGVLQIKQAAMRAGQELNQRTTFTIFRLIDFNQIFLKFREQATYTMVSRAYCKSRKTIKGASE